MPKELFRPLLAFLVLLVLPAGFLLCMAVCGALDNGPAPNPYNSNSENREPHPHEPSLGGGLIAMYFLVTTPIAAVYCIVYALEKALGKRPEEPHREETSELIHWLNDNQDQDALEAASRALRRAE